MTVRRTLAVAVALLTAVGLAGPPTAAEATPTVPAAVVPAAVDPGTAQAGNLAAPAADPAAGPILGRRHQVTYDRYSLMLDGRRLLLQSAEFHYFRLPSPDLWRDVLEKLKAAGFNSVSLYFDWAYHSPKAGCTTSPASGTSTGCCARPRRSGSGWSPDPGRTSTRRPPAVGSRPG
ncbi:hypothetical protein GCM10027605_16410 [Micromonospora zhanjiangensis]